MALIQKLQMRQSQALVMTPQLMQAIKLLQLSNLELSTYVEGELERNPLLERGETEGAPGEAEAAPEAEAPRSDDSRSGDWLGEDLETSRTAIEDRLGTKLDNVFPDDGAPAAPRAGSEGVPVPSDRGAPRHADDKQLAHG